MTLTVLVLMLGAGDAVAEAGNAYRQAREAVKAEKYEEAVQLLRGAIQQVGEESEQLKYRDDTSRRRHAYYPYFEWGRARLLQSQQETNIYNQRDLIADAISRLGQSRHPDAAANLEEAKAKLETVKQAIALDASFTGVKTGIEVLGSGDRFKEGFKQIDEAAARFKGRKKELEEVRMVLKEKQIVVVRRYEQMLMQRLGDVVLMDPATAGDSIVPLIKPALVPEDVIENGGPMFDWARAFIAEWEKHVDVVRRAAELPGAQVNSSADALEQAALGALAVNLPAGFRACRHLAQAGRLGKLREIATGNEDVLDVKTAGEVVASAATAAKRGAAGVADKEPREQLEKELAVHEKQIAELDRKIQAGAKERARLTGPIQLAETQLADGDTLGDIKALNELKSNLFELQSEATFGTLTARLRARAFFAHGLAEATLAFLEGKTVEQAVDRARQPIYRAYGFDAKVDARWLEKTSPKMLKVFDQLRPEK